MIKGTLVASLAASDEVKADLLEIESEFYDLFQNVRDEIAREDGDPIVALSFSTEILDAKLQESDCRSSQPVACKKGCSSCCTTHRILLDALEVVRMVRDGKSPSTLTRKLKGFLKPLRAQLDSIRPAGVSKYTFLCEQRCIGFNEVKIRKHLNVFFSKSKYDFRHILAPGSALE